MGKASAGPRLVYSRPILSSEPTPERLLRSGGHFEEGKDGRGAKILAFRDYPLAVAHRTGAITARQHEAGERYHQYWYHAGLAGSVPAIQPDKPIVVGGENFGGAARSNEEYNHRLLVRGAWKAVGFERMRILESGICWQWLVDWESDKVQRGLNRLADHWGA